VALVGDGEGGFAAVRVSGDGDLVSIDQTVETSLRPAVHAEQLADHKTDVLRLVDEVGFVRAAGCVRVLDGEDGRGDDIAGSRPRVEQPLVGARH
jgi:hypothetical protein